jgi:hypothetical protein
MIFPRMPCWSASMPPNSSAPFVGPLPQKLPQTACHGQGIIRPAPQTLAVFAPAQSPPPLRAQQQVGPSPPGPSPGTNTWVLDTGATSHMSSSDSILLVFLTPLHLSLWPMVTPCPSSVVALPFFPQPSLPFPSTMFLLPLLLCTIFSLFVSLPVIIIVPLNLMLLAFLSKTP